MATKKVSSAQIAARKLFAQRAKAGTLGKSRSYSGKYPNRIAQVESVGRGVLNVKTNAGDKYIVRAADTNGDMPEIGEEISLYVTRQPNPITKPVSNRRSVSEALAVNGPSETLYSWRDHFIVQWRNADEKKWTTTGVFKTINDASIFARSYHRTYPDSFIRVVIAEK